MQLVRPSVDLRGKCPYCEYTWSIEVRDIRGELNALRCIDCKTAFVVDVSVELSHTVHALADIDRDDVLDAFSTCTGVADTPSAPATRRDKRGADDHSVGRCSGPERRSAGPNKFLGGAPLRQRDPSA